MLTTLLKNPYASWVYRVSQEAQKIMSEYNAHKKSFNEAVNTYFSSKTFPDKLRSFADAYTTLDQSVDELFNSLSQSAKAIANPVATTPKLTSSYTTNLDVLEKTVNPDLVEILRGQSTYTANGKKKRAWAWKDRAKQISAYVQNNTVSDEEKKYVKKALHNHSYLQKKYPSLSKQIQLDLDAA